MSPGAPRVCPVEALHLSRRFGGRVALDDLSLSIEPGESFGLLGPNGAGKTTFIRLVTGFLLPSAGVLRVGGVSPGERPGEVTRRLGFVMETSRLYPELRVEGFLRFAGGARGLRGAALAEAVERVLGDFGLTGTARRVIGNLSKGFQQRVSVAQAFLCDPPLVIVDEPTGGLDPLQRGEVHELLLALRGERTLLVCTHDLDEARRLTTRAAVLRAGRRVALGATDELLGARDALDLFRVGAAS